MVDALIAAACLLWCTTAVAALAGRFLDAARIVTSLGCLLGVIAALIAPASGTGTVTLPFLRIADTGAAFRLPPDALWLMGFGLAPAGIVALLGTPAKGRNRLWLFGLAMSLLGALGVFGIDTGPQFLVAWEVMSLGGAALILGDGLGPQRGTQALFMLGLLEVGAVALLVAMLTLATTAETFGFAGITAATQATPLLPAAIAGVLLVVGFGAKLGLLPFYEWFPGAYGTGSGASGAIMSGIVLNAAFFGLARGLLDWLPHRLDTGFGIFLCAVGVISGILTALYAFQQEDWRSLLSLSSAENASVAVIALGASMLFRGGGEAMLAGLAFTVALLHLAGHTLAKSCLFLNADALFRATGSYAITQRGAIRRNRLIFGIGALFATMSLAAMPPQAGFVSEWFMFETVFQGFHLHALGGRLTLAFSGAGLALTAAISLATYVKLFGVGLLGRSTDQPVRIRSRDAGASLALGSAVLALAVGMPIWLGAVSGADLAYFGSDAAAHMTDGWLLVPLSAGFAFISPSKLIIVMPLLALLPLALMFAFRRNPVVRRPVWYGGSDAALKAAATTSLTFANSLRTFYSFVYRPSTATERETRLLPYYVTRLTFDENVAPIFGPYLFAPSMRLARNIARFLRPLQSGRLNVYLAILGILLVVILAISFG